MKFLTLTAALLLCSAAAAVTLPEVPVTGSRLDRLDQNLFQCRATQNEAVCRRPGKPTERIGDEPVIEIVLFYRDGVLVRSVFAFDEGRSDALAQQLSGQLGTAIEGSELLKAGMGGVFENRYYVFKRDGRVWFFEQFFERIMNSGLWVMDDAEFAALLAERERVRVRGARDL